jgi:hypothetical protein
LERGLRGLSIKPAAAVSRGGVAEGRCTGTVYSGTAARNPMNARGKKKEEREETGTCSGTGVNSGFVDIRN